MTAEHLIALIEDIGRDPDLKPAYREHTQRCVEALRRLHAITPMTERDVLLLLLGWNMAQAHQMPTGQ